MILYEQGLDNSGKDKLNFGRRPPAGSGSKKGSHCSWLGFSKWSLVLSGSVQVCPSTVMPVGLTGNSKLAVSVAISAVLMDYVSFDILSWNKS